MDLTPDGPLGERDQDMNTLPTETVGTTHHGCGRVQSSFTFSLAPGVRRYGRQRPGPLFSAALVAFSVSSDGSSTLGGSTLDAI